MLIESGSGTVTPYGVVYDNGMKLEQIYDGQFFPCYPSAAEATGGMSAPTREEAQRELIAAAEGTKRRAYNTPKAEDTT